MAGVRSGSETSAECRPKTSGSSEFDQLRARLNSDLQLRYEVEALLRLIVETYNPSDRGVRFITGGIGEWALAMAAYSAGVLTLPDGHNADGNDLRGVLDQSRALWSVKGSNRVGGNFTISNGKGGPGAGFTVPTVFWSPELPGFVYGDPELHPCLVDAQIERKDAMELPKKTVAAHAARQPECVAELKIPVNPGTASRDPSFEAVKLLVQGGSFPRLRRLLDDASRVDTSVVGQIKELQVLRDQGVLSQSQFESAISKVTAL